MLFGAVEMNNTFKTAAFVLLSFISGFGFGLIFKFYYETNTFQPYAWDSPPIIVNCYGNDFSELQMIRAIDYWTLRGQSIAFYEHSPSDEICKNEYIEGFIILRKSKRYDHESGVLARTRRYTTMMVMKGAVITYRPGTQNLVWINEHELGHALGFAHVEILGHIMLSLIHI